MLYLLRMTQVKLARNLIKNKPYLAWDVGDVDKLSSLSVMEHVLGYGDWEDFINFEKIFGTKEARVMFEGLKSKKRVNLNPQTINYFSSYFNKYA